MTARTCNASSEQPFTGSIEEHYGSATCSTKAVRFHPPNVNEHFRVWQLFCLLEGRRVGPGVIAILRTTCHNQNPWPCRITRGCTEQHLIQFTDGCSSTRTLGVHEQENGGPILRKFESRVGRPYAGTFCIHWCIGGKLIAGNPCPTSN